MLQIPRRALALLLSSTQLAYVRERRRTYADCMEILAAAVFTGSPRPHDQNLATVAAFQPALRGDDRPGINRHYTRQAEHKMAAGPLWRDHGLIFTSETGAPLDPENFSRAFAKLCNRAGLGHWHPYELRHSGASLMLAQGTPLHVVSEILGHASITIPKDVYGHLVVGTGGLSRRP